MVEGLRIYFGGYMVENCGLYIVSDLFFERYDKQQKLMLNKNESRPFYCGITADNGVLWLIPLSSKVDKYRKLIEVSENKYGRGKCIFHYIAKVKGTERAFLISNTFPCSEKYIVRPFTVDGVPYVVKNKKDISEIQKRLARYIALVRAGKFRPSADILAIEKILLEDC